MLISSLEVVAISRSALPTSASFWTVVAGAVAADAHHIIDVDDIFNEARLLIDNRHPVFPDQLRGKAGANLARAHNNDLHIAPFRRTAPT